MKRERGRGREPKDWLNSRPGSFRPLSLRIRPYCSWLEVSHKSEQNITPWQSCLIPNSMFSRRVLVLFLLIPLEGRSSQFVRRRRRKKKKKEEEESKHWKSGFLPHTHKRIKETRCLCTHRSRASMNVKGPFAVFTIFAERRNRLS